MIMEYMPQNDVAVGAAVMMSSRAFSAALAVATDRKRSRYASWPLIMPTISIGVVLFEQLDFNLSLAY